MPRPIWYPAALMAALILLTAASFMSASLWAFGAQLAVVGLGIVQARRASYWHRHGWMLTSWRLLAHAAMLLYRGHRHGDDHACYTATSGVVAFRRWYTICVVPGADNRHTGAVVHGAIHVYLFRDRDFTITHHQVPFTAWPFSNGVEGGWTEDTIRVLVRDRYRGRGTVLTAAEMDDLSAKIRNTWPMPAITTVE